MRTLLLIVALSIGACSSAPGAADTPDAAWCYEPPVDLCDPNLDPKDRTRFREQLGDQCVMICCEFEGEQYRGAFCGYYTTPADAAP